MPRQQIIEVNYEMPFKGMLVQAGVPKHQRAKIFAQLESEELFFEFKTRRSFEIEDVNFNEPILSRKVSRLIRAASIGETEWKPFDIEHLLAYFMKSPAKFKSGFVFASKRVYGVEGVPGLLSPPISPNTTGYQKQYNNCKPPTRIRPVWVVLFLAYITIKP